MGSVREKLKGQGLVPVVADDGYSIMYLPKKQNPSPKPLRHLTKGYYLITNGLKA
jgi:hypothetical protein